MERHENLDPDDLLRPDWNGLVENYNLHDIAEAYFRGRVEETGLQTEQWGLDNRHDDEAITFDNKMDLRLWRPHPSTDADIHVPDTYTGEYVTQEYYDGNLMVDVDQWQLRGLVDVKSKRSEDWLGVLNLRHFAHYAEWARKYDVPVFIYFTLVDMDEEEVGDENILVEVEPFDRLDEYVEHFGSRSNTRLDWSAITDDCEIVERTWSHRDGNAVVKLDESAYQDFDWFEQEVLQ